MKMKTGRAEQAVRLRKGVKNHEKEEIAEPAAGAGPESDADHTGPGGGETELQRCAAGPLGL